MSGNATYQELAAIRGKFGYATFSQVVERRVSFPVGEIF